MTSVVVVVVVVLNWFGCSPSSRSSSENISHWKTEQDSGKKEIAQLALDLFSLLIDAQLAVTFVIK